MVELRKRKAPPPAPEPAAKKKSAPKKPPAARPTARQQGGEQTQDESQVPTVGNRIELDGFGGEVETSGGETTTLSALVEDSESGVVLFTYPKASTPGCTWFCSGTYTSR